MSDDLRQQCNGADDPRERCGVHHCTDVGNMFGGYDCCCGLPWLTRKCMNGAKEGERVSLEQELREVLSYTVADAPHDVDAHLAGVLAILERQKQ